MGITLDLPEFLNSDQPLIKSNLTRKKVTRHTVKKNNKNISTVLPIMTTKTIRKSQYQQPSKNGFDHIDLFPTLPKINKRYDMSKNSISESLNTLLESYSKTYKKTINN